MSTQTPLPASISNLQYKGFKDIPAEFEYDVRDEQKEYNYGHLVTVRTYRKGFGNEVTYVYYNPTGEILLFRAGFRDSAFNYAVDKFNMNKSRYSDK